MDEARVGDHDIEPAELLDDGFHHRLRRIVLGDIERRRFRVQATPAQLLGGRMRGVGIAAVEHDRRAGFGEALGHGKAKPARGAGDESNASVQ